MLVSSAVLAALVVTSALAEEDELTVGAETAGVVAGGALAIGGRSIVTVRRRRGGATAGLRASGLSGGSRDALSLAATNVAVHSNDAGRSSAAA